ncbi:MAG: TetR family transcriptional regulator [Thermoleophilaceae bacterium]|nr:TetR family transcriptional regulator [Thermoleophilaceae bacterium]
MATRPETHRTRGLERRAALLDAAIEVVADHGIAGVTHRAVAARAGFPPSTTSYFFASIDELLLEAMRERIARNTERLELLTTLMQSQIASGQGFDVDEIAGAFAQALVDPPTVELIAQFDMYVTAARRDDVRQHVQAMVAAYEQLAATALTALGVETPAVVARAMVALADGFLLRALTTGSDRNLIAEQLRVAFRALIAGYASVAGSQPATRAERPTRIHLVKEDQTNG